MIKSIRLIAVVSILTIALSSCLSTEIENETRTPELEKKELNITIETLENEGFDVDTTESGMYYVVQLEGEGPTVQEGDTCYIEYAGYFLDGTLFDASANHYEDAVWKFIYKDVSLIPGFEEAIGMLSKGAEMDFIIPSDLAYGSAGAPGIPPYTSLLFATKLNELKQKIE